MELHRNTRPLVRGIGLLVLAVVAAFSPQLLAALNYEFVFGNWIGYLIAVLAVIGAIAQIAEFRRRFAVRIDERGIVWVHGTSTVAFAWADVSRVTIDKKADAGKWAKPTVLTVWTPTATPYPAQPHVVLTGLNGYKLADLGDVTQSPDQVVAALRQFGGDRYLAAAQGPAR